MSQRRHARSDTGVVRARRLTVPVLHGALDFVILSAVIRLVTAGIQGLFDALAVGQLVASLLAGAVLAIGAETCVAVRRDRRQGLILAWISASVIGWSLALVQETYSEAGISYGWQVMVGISLFAGAFLALYQLSLVVTGLHRAST